MAFYVKNLGRMWTIKHATPRRNFFFFKGWTYLYIFNLQIFIIYLFIKEFIFYWYMKILQREKQQQKCLYCAIILLWCLCL